MAEGAEHQRAQPVYRQFIENWPDNVPHIQQLNQTHPTIVPIYTLADQEVPLTVNTLGVSEEKHAVPHCSVLKLKS